MKKKDLKKLAIMGITGALLAGSQGVNADQGSMEGDQLIAGMGGGKHSCGGPGGCGGEKKSNGMKTGKHMSEDDLVKQLNPEMKKVYENLSPEGKKLAQKLANQTCKGYNECKGLNSCRTKENTCAGEGNCRGKGSCEFKDKNMAVKVAAKKMAEKRNRLHNQ